MSRGEGKEETVSSVWRMIKNSISQGLKMS
jgi:hypothetical protein